MKNLTLPGGEHDLHVGWSRYRNGGAWLFIGGRHIHLNNLQTRQLIAYLIKVICRGMFR